MHELAVTEALLELSLRHGQAARAARITNVYVVIGQLSSVIDESVQFYWDLISAGTLAAGARLHFRRVPAELGCGTCGQRFSPTAEVLACPVCGSLTVHVVAGEELYLEALDVEPRADAQARTGTPVPSVEAASP